jgi:hypothetical protein
VPPPCATDTTLYFVQGYIPAPNNFFAQGGKVISQAARNLQLVDDDDDMTMTPTTTDEMMMQTMAGTGDDDLTESAPVASFKFFKGPGAFNVDKGAVSPFLKNIRSSSLAAGHDPKLNPGLVTMNASATCQICGYEGSQSDVTGQFADSCAFQTDCPKLGGLASDYPGLKPYQLPYVNAFDRNATTSTSIVTAPLSLGCTSSSDVLDSCGLTIADVKAAVVKALGTDCAVINVDQQLESAYPDLQDDLNNINDARLFPEADVTETYILTASTGDETCASTVSNFFGSKDSESDLRAALTPELSPDTILSGLTLDKPTVFVVPTIGTDRASMNAANLKMMETSCGSGVLPCVLVSSEDGGSSGALGYPVVRAGDVLTVSMQNFPNRREVKVDMSSRCSPSETGTPMFSVKSFDDKAGPVVVEFEIKPGTPEGTYSVRGTSQGSLGAAGLGFCSQPFMVKA